MKITLDTIEKVYKSKPVSRETMELKGYELVKELFVDSSGFGMDDEPALTKNQFTEELTNLLREHEELYATLTGVGQFQVYIGLFRKLPQKKNWKIVSTNVLEYMPEAWTKVIRLYDTDIVTIKPHEMILNNGGYQTRTTAKWINKYLPEGYILYSKNWEWIVEHKGEKTKFSEGMRIVY